MLTPSPMELVILVVFKEKAEAVTSSLLQLGIFHPVNWQSLEKDLQHLSPVDVEKEMAAWQVLENRFREVEKYLGQGKVPASNRVPLTAEQVGEKLTFLERKLKSFQEKQTELLEQIKTRQSMLNQIMKHLPLPIIPQRSYSFLDVRLGAVKKNTVPVLERSLSPVAHLLLPVREENNRIIFLLVGLKRNRALLDNICQDTGWENVEYAEEQFSSGAVEEKLKDQLAVLQQQLDEVNQKVKKLAEESSAELGQISFSIALRKSLLKTSRNMLVTERTCLLAGWVPADKTEEVRKHVQDLASVFYLEKKPAEKTGVPKEEIPVFLAHHRLLKPFDLLVKAYGLPRYGTVDPTVFVAIAFLIMFGAMFGDIGHGFLLALVGFFLQRSRNKSLQQPGALLFYCGLSGIVFGFLYGSFFGVESFPAVWARPLQNITSLFQASLAFGVMLVSLGVILNIINSVRDHDYLRAIFDKSGLLSGVVYWIGIAALMRWVSAKVAIWPGYIYILAGGFFLLFLGPFFQMRHQQQHGFLETFMESVINLLEIVMGYLANTVSFLRVAAFALAHAGLFLAIFQLASFSSKSQHLVSGIILILGNILIVLLEGLVVTIQSLRLNYYEFFSRFFVSAGQEYRPLVLP